MKKKLKIACVAYVFVFCIAALACQADVINIIQNSDMESNTGGVVDAWLLDSWGSNRAYAYTTEYSHSATHSIKLYNASDTAYASGDWYQNAAVTAGTEYTFTGWVKGVNIELDTGGHAGIGYKWLDAGGSQIGNVGEIYISSGTTDWTLLTRTVVAPENAVQVKFYTIMYKTKGDVYTDDMSVTYTSIPEPATLSLLMGVSLLNFLFSKKVKRQ